MKPMALLLLLTVLLSAAGLTPFPSHELSRLLPAELLVLSAAEGGIAVRTEDGLAAWGPDLPGALAALQAAAPGTLLLSTVDQVVLTGLEPVPQALRELGLRPGTGVSAAPWVEDPAALCRYLSAGKSRVTLGMLLEGPDTPVPRLVQGASGLYFPEKKGM